MSPTSHTSHTVALAELGSDTTVREVAAKANDLALRAKSLQVIDEATLSDAGHMLVQLKQAGNEVERVRGMFVKPLKEHVRSMEAFFKRASEPLELADKALRASVARYRMELEAKAELARRKLIRAAEEAARLAEEKRAQAAAESREAKEELLSQADTLEFQAQAAAVAIDGVQGAPKRTSAGAGSVSGFARWTFEVTEPERVPREYLEVSQQAIRRAVQAGMREIPGVRIFQTQTLVVRDG